MTEIVLGDSLDTYDLAILNTLTNNSDLSSIELSSIVHLSRTAVVRRINNLRERGLMGCSAVDVDYEALGFGIHAYVHVKAPSKHSYILQDTLWTRPEVLSISVVMGATLLVVEVVAANTDHLHRFLIWLEDIADSETIAILRQHQSPMGLRDRLRKANEMLTAMENGLN